MIKAMMDQWRKLDAEYAAAHQEYLRMQPVWEEQNAAPLADGFEARVAAKVNLARAQRAMHEFCKQHTDILVGMREG
jgi:hypothetical protein